MLALKVEDLSKQYRLGQIGTGTLSHDLNRLWARVRGKEDPYAKIGATNDRTQKATSDYVWALKDINFEIEQGDAVGIIGRNGAGKSTLLKILSRTTLPTTGSVKVKGRIASLLEVGTGFHPEMTGRENIYQNGALLGMTRSEIKRKFDEIVDFSGCEAYIDTPVKRYSSGMYVRLAFAVAAHLESEILIVDEVLAVGDAEFQKKCLGKMNDVSKGEGRTVLFVSHNMAAVKSLCNKGILMQNGRVIENDKIDCVIDKYHDVFLDKINYFPSNRKITNGNGNIIFTNIRLLNEDHQEMEYFTNGEKGIIEIDIKTKEPLHKNVLFWIQIKKAGELLCTISNDLNSSLFTVTNQNKVKCSIDKIPFFEGTYTLSLLCLENGIFTDYAEDIFVFNIIDGQFYNTGRTPIEKSGIMIDHNWEIM